jgi:hypothetical protein
MATEMAGKKGRCGCGTVFVIPATSQPAESIPTAQPVAQQPAAQQPAAQQPAAQQPVAGIPLGQPAAADPFQPSHLQQPAAQQPIQQPIQQQPVAAEPLLQPPAAADPLLQQPMAADPLLQQPMAADSLMQPMAQQPYAQQPVGGNWGSQMAGGYGRSSGGSTSLLFVGHQLAFWPRIGTLAGLLLFLISLTIALSTDSDKALSIAGTLQDITGYLLLIANIVCLIGLGFFLSLPRQTGAWGLALAAFITCIVGDLLGSICILADSNSVVLLVITVMVYFAGGLMTCVMLKALMQYYRQDDAIGVAVGGIVMNAVTAGFFLLMVILEENQFFMGDPDNVADAVRMAKTVMWIVVISSYLITLMWSAVVGLEMGTLGKLRGRIRHS